MKQSIFDINKKYTELLNEIEESEGVITDEVSKELDITVKDVEEKFYNYAYIIQKLQGESKVIDDEIARLNKLKNIKNNSIKSLEKIVLAFLPKYGNRVKAGQGFKYVFDLGKIKLENKYTKPLTLSEEFQGKIQKIVDSIILGDNEEIERIKQEDSNYENFIENLHKYIEISYQLSSEKVKDLKNMLDILSNQEYNINKHEVKVKINNIFIKNDLKEDIERPGAKIDHGYCKLVIK